jgi:phosphomannomutase
VSRKASDPLYGSPRIGVCSTLKQQEELARPVIRVKFGTAGIRGIYGHEVSIRETLAVCFAVHRMLGQGRFGLGYDTRKTSSVLAGVACAAMNWYGSDVDDYGIIPTPVLAFNIKNNKLHAGFSVTASHNPPEYAGVKVYGTDGIEFSLEAEHKLEELIQKSSEYSKVLGDENQFGSTFENEEAIMAYSDALIKSVPSTGKKFNILVDCANGTAGNVTPRILSDLGHHVVTVNAHQSESFPGRMPEPMPETLGEVCDLVKRIGADFAIAHDGDADRLVMIDERGFAVPDYALSCLLLEIVIERGKRGTVIISINSSKALEEVALRNGCRVIYSRLGKTFEELYRRRGVYASEPSKTVDPRWGYWEDGIYAGVLVAQYLSETGKTLSEALSSVPRYWNFQKNVTSLVLLDYDEIDSKIRSTLGDGEISSVETLDGIKFYLKDGAWIMFRSSGTERKARVYVESTNEQRARSLLQLGMNLAHD